MCVTGIKVDFFVRLGLIFWNTTQMVQSKMQDLRSERSFGILLGLVTNQCRNFFLNSLHEFSLNNSGEEVLPI